MSITLDKLRALKRQAGTADAPAGSRVAPPPANAQANTGEDARSSVPVAPMPAPAGGLRPSQLPIPPAQPDDASRAVASPARVAQPAVRDTSPRPDATSRAPDAAKTAETLHTLRRLLGVRERKPLLPPTPRAPLDRSLPGTEIAPGLHCIETRLPFPAPTDALPLAFARRDTHVDPRTLLFFDTETTGLAGGTGTRAFMIGAADWIDDTLRIRQLLISTMAAETAMLREFATWLSPDTVLASYNGRSYDAPLLKTRYRLARLPDPLHALDHLDLLHPTRRRYRGRWENCRLATIERELLRIVREDDLPGSQAPAAWLGFLRGGASTLLHRVCAHNHQDVVTLARLMLQLVEAQAAE